MNIFDVLTLIGGLCLFLFGMNLMGEALERRAGGSLRTILGKLTTKKWVGLITGMGVTAIIQSSSATTVMVVGFVNSGLMTLKQAINVIMGANVGTTITAWILSLGGIDGDAIFVKLLKPTSFTPILALIGVIFYMFMKDRKKQDTGLILLGFATLMFGMETMSDAVAGLKNVPQFQQLFVMFQNPILGVLVGAIVTAIIQSSSASVGILQALSATGQVSLGAAIPIIMGQNIGTCITAMLSSVGTNKNARRTAIVHLSFNVVGTVFLVSVFSAVRALAAPAILSLPASEFTIAVAHSAFNIICTLLLFPMSGLLEKIAYRILPETENEKDNKVELDDRLLATPSIALEQCHNYTVKMAYYAKESVHKSVKTLFDGFSEEVEDEVRDLEKKTDHYEDILGTYLVKLSNHHASDDHNSESAKLLKIIGDLERMTDHSMNVLRSAKELMDKNISLTESGASDMRRLTAAVEEIVDLTCDAFVEGNKEKAALVEPLEGVIDVLKRQLKSNHIIRLQQGECSIEAGFVWSDLLTNLERTSDHCPNIAGYVLDTDDLNIHDSLKHVRKESESYKIAFQGYAAKYGA